MVSARGCLYGPVRAMGGRLVSLVLYHDQQAWGSEIGTTYSNSKAVWTNRCIETEIIVSILCSSMAVTNHNKGKCK